MGYIPIRNFSEDFPGKKQKPRTELDQARAQLADDASHRHAFSLRNELARFEDEFRQKAGPNSDETPEGLTARAVEYRDKCQHYLGNQTTTPYERGLFDEMAGESKRPWVRHWAQQEARMTVALNQRVAQDAKDAVLRDALLNPADFDHVNRLVQAFVVISTKLKTPHEGAEAEINDQVFHKLLDDGLLEAAGQRLQYMIDQGMLNEKGATDRQTRVDSTGSRQRISQGYGLMMDEARTWADDDENETDLFSLLDEIGLGEDEKQEAGQRFRLARQAGKKLKTKEKNQKADSVWLSACQAFQNGDMNLFFDTLGRSEEIDPEARKAFMGRMAKGKQGTGSWVGARIRLEILEGRIRNLDQVVKAGMNMDRLPAAHDLIRQVTANPKWSMARVIRKKVEAFGKSLPATWSDQTRQRESDAFLFGLFQFMDHMKLNPLAPEAEKLMDQFASEYRTPPPRREDRSELAVILEEVRKAGINLKKELDNRGLEHTRENAVMLAHQMLEE